MTRYQALYVQNMALTDGPRKRCARPWTIAILSVAFGISPQGQSASAQVRVVLNSSVIVDWSSTHSLDNENNECEPRHISLSELFKTMTYVITYVVQDRSGGRPSQKVNIKLPGHSFLIPSRSKQSRCATSD